MASLTQVPCEKLFSRIHTPPKEKLIHIIESVIGQGGVVDLDVEFCYHFELSPTLKEEVNRHRKPKRKKKKKKKRRKEEKERECRKDREDKK